jgi:hypothetical protein
VVLIAKRNGRGSLGQTSLRPQRMGDVCGSAVREQEPSTPPTVEPATPTMLLPANAQATAVIQILSAAARLPAQAGGRSPTPNSTAGRGTPCPVHPIRDCLGCHMPKVPMPDLHTSLTDHYMRIHNRGQSGVGQMRSTRGTENVHQRTSRAGETAAR